jgi:hypothetical protein
MTVASGAPVLDPMFPVAGLSALEGVVDDYRLAATKVEQHEIWEAVDTALVDSRIILPVVKPRPPFGVLKNRCNGDLELIDDVSSDRDVPSRSSIRR